MIEDSLKIMKDIIDDEQNRVPIRYYNMTHSRNFRKDVL